MYKCGVSKGLSNDYFIKKNGSSDREMFFKQSWSIHEIDAV